MSVNNSQPDNETINAVLARAFVGFQDSYLSMSPSQGLLCQSWLPTAPQDVDPEQLPDSSSSNFLVLRTKGNPFFVAGQTGADHLAFFRCISCRYTFGTDVSVPTELGAPGRVFITGKPEMLGNVGAMAREDFHRSDHAKTCSVQSCMILPVFYPDVRRKCIGVIEVLTNNPDLAYSRLCAMVGAQLAKHGLATCKLSDMDSEGAGEISPTLQQRNIMAMPFQSHPGHQSERSPHAREINPRISSEDNCHDHNNRHDQVDGGIGFVTGRDSVRLGVTLADLKTLMKQKRIKTLSRNSMGRYEEDVDLVLDVSEHTIRKVPSEKAIDSRWDAARRLPQKRKAQLQAKQRTRSKDFMDGGFPVVRQADGRLVADYHMIAQSLGPKRPGTTTTVNRSGVQRAPGRASAGISAVPSSNGAQVAGSGDADLIQAAERCGSGGIGGGTLSGGDSEDWLGMIDPQMLDLMVNDNILDAVGNLDNIQLF